MKKVVAWLSLAVILVLSGCASYDPQAIRSQTSGKSVAVSSRLGDKLNLSWIGTTVFNNESGEISIADWKIDEAVAKGAVDSLRNAKRYAQVFPVAGIKRGTDGTVDASAAGKADYLVLIESASYQDRAFMTNQFLKGIGVAQRTMFNSVKRTVGHASVSVEVIDVKSGKPVGTFGKQGIWPSVVSLETGPKIAESDLSQFKADTIRNVQGAVAEALEKLGLE
jgi:hypothetical protein